MLATRAVAILFGIVGLLALVSAIAVVRSQPNLQKEQHQHPLANAKPDPNSEAIGDSRNEAERTDDQKENWWRRSMGLLERHAVAGGAAGELALLGGHHVDIARHK
jgi:hypothetical protein